MGHSLSNISVIPDARLILTECVALLDLITLPWAGFGKLTVADASPSKSSRSASSRPPAYSPTESNAGLLPGCHRLASDLSVASGLGEDITVAVDAIPTLGRRDSPPPPLLSPPGPYSRFPGGARGNVRARELGWERR